MQAATRICVCGTAIPPNRGGKPRRFCTPVCRDRFHATGDAKKNRLLKHRYGITLEQYNEMSAAVDSTCPACGTRTVLAVDHDHDTGRIRGLLCPPCNFAVGHAHNSPSTLRALAEYLESRII